MSVVGGRRGSRRCSCWPAALLPAEASDVGILDYAASNLRRVGKGAVYLYCYYTYELVVRQGTICGDDLWVMGSVPLLEYPLMSERRCSTSRSQEARNMWYM